MFAHPATHHIGRTYTGYNPTAYPTTGRKNLNKENAGGALPSKTPSRAMKGLVPATSIRTGLGVKSALRDGNVMRGGDEAKDKDKGKGKDEEIGPKRLFANTAAGPSKSALPPSKSLSSLPPLLSHPPRSAKTPGPVRPQALRTPAPVPPTPLPSAGRTRRRSRQSLTPLRPVEFKTPAPSARWEEEVSLGSIGEVGVELDEVEEGDEGEGDDEIEYMPPKMPDLPWDPPFDYPDPIHAFSVLSRVPPLWTPYEDPLLPVPQLDPEEQMHDGVRLCDDDLLEEPMFRRKQPVQSGNPVKPTSGAVRPASAAPRPATSSTTTRRLPPLSSVRVSRPVANPPDAQRARPTRPTVTRAPPPRNPTSVAGASRPAAARPIARRGAAPATRPRPVVDIKVPAVQIGEVELDALELDVEFDLDL